MDTSQTTIKFNPGDFLIKEKSACDALFIIKEGQLEVYKTSSSGEKIPIGIISSGQYAGETALLLGKPHTSNVVALTPGSAIKLSRTSVEAQLKSVPPWLISLTKGLIERLHSANDILRRNGLVDESLASQLKAFEQKFKKETSPEGD